MKLPRNSKRGITLVEVIVGVFVLSIFAVGILSLLIYNNQAVADSAQQKADYSAAIQKLDIIIAAVSNTAVPKDDATEAEKEACFLKKNASGDVSLDKDDLAAYLGIDQNVWTIEPARDPASVSESLRGWYITLTYNVTRTVRGEDVLSQTVVKGYASFAEGAFDK